MKEYYTRYDERYKAVYAAGAERWGHNPKDEELTHELTQWVNKYALKGKRIIEYAAGEGAGGYVLCSLGCDYTGIEISEAACEKARSLLSGFPHARVIAMDMVKECAQADAYDAAFDSMGIHMLITDAHRKAYLKNMFTSLKKGAPAFFFHECYLEDAYSGSVDSLDEWAEITKSDYSSKEERTVQETGQTVLLPRLPARPKNKQDYIKEFEDAGFIVDEFINIGESRKCIYAASIHVHKP